MAYGEHWEWRAFGGLSSRFARAFLLLPGFYDGQKITDEYLWVPGMDVNVKLRKGAESGLKFKRNVKSSEPFEVWQEDEDELFEFPLDEEAWNSLATIFRDSEISLPGYPAIPPNREHVTEILEELGCGLVTVQKLRETRKLEISSGSVLVEWATIKTPQPCCSVGLECWAEDPDIDLTDEASLDTIREALSQLSLDEEPLQPLNYLEAVESWANGHKI
ncbi:MAG: hypothetical protein R3281_02210 [Balneolaceae bacterium]|nr:hypothetical protein [Balneolaceae bacterium]